MNTRTHIDSPSLPLLRRTSTLIAMGTVGLALVAAGPASAEDSTTTTTTVSKLKTKHDTVKNSINNVR